MAIWNFWKKGRKKTGHDLTDEDREQAEVMKKARWEAQRLQLARDQELAQLKAEREQLKIQADIQRYRDIIGDDGEEEEGMEDQLLAGILQRSLGGRSFSPSDGVASSGSPPTPSAIFLSDEQLMEIWGKVPKPYRKMAKGMTEQQIDAIIQQKVGVLDPDTRARAFKLIRTQS